MFDQLARTENEGDGSGSFRVMLQIAGHEWQSRFRRNLDKAGVVRIGKSIDTQAGYHPARLDFQEADNPIAFGHRDIPVEYRMSMERRVTVLRLRSGQLLIHSTAPFTLEVRAGCPRSQA